MLATVLQLSRPVEAATATPAELPDHLAAEAIALLAVLSERSRDLALNLLREFRLAERGRV